MPRTEYMKVRLNYIPKDIQKRYNLVNNLCGNRQRHVRASERRHPRLRSFEDLIEEVRLLSGRWYCEDMSTLHKTTAVLCLRRRFWRKILHKSRRTTRTRRGIGRYIRYTVDGEETNTVA